MFSDQIIRKALVKLGRLQRQCQMLLIIKLLTDFQQSGEGIMSLLFFKRMSFFWNSIWLGKGLIRVLIWKKIQKKNERGGAVRTEKWKV